MGLRQRDQPGMLRLMNGAMTQRKRAAYVPVALARPPAGPAITALRAVAAWTACIIRCLAIGYIALQVVIWHSFYAADPWRLAGPFVAMAWAAVVVAYLRGRWQMWWRDGLDSAASVLLALGAGWCVPPAVRGDTTNWLYIAMVGQLFVPAWLAPVASAAPLALITAAAYLAGATVTHPVRADGSSAAASAALLVAIAAAAWFGRLMLERGALAADATLASADREAREQRVALSRTTERREHERLLHDTVLNTLTAIGRASGADAGQLVGRCRRVLKSEETSQVQAAIKAVAAGMDWISPRLAYILAADDAPDRPVLSAQETRALRLYATGMPMKSVARRMVLSEETVKQYVGRVRLKYARAGRAAPTKIELYYRAVEDGHLPPYPTPRNPPTR
jgi:hypothetical protein